jgi:integrase
MPNIPPSEEVNEFVPSTEEVESVQSYYRRFEYASRAHVEFEIITEIGLRMGAVRAIDLSDLDRENLAIHLRHRPESRDEYGTPLKNGLDGERIVNISESLQRFIDDYIEHNRNDVLDEYGRNPLFTTSAGRVTTTTMRRDFYKMTRPCTYSNECPHDREQADCDATRSQQASSCPSSSSTHPLRKWSIMHQLDEGVPKELLSDRVDVSVPVLDKHYDQRSEERKSRRRREALEATLTQYAMTDGGTPVEDDRE